MYLKPCIGRSVLFIWILYIIWRIIYRHCKLTAIWNRTRLWFEAQSSKRTCKRYTDLITGCFKRASRLGREEIFNYARFHRTSELPACRTVAGNFSAKPVETHKKEKKNASTGKFQRQRVLQKYDDVKKILVRCEGGFKGFGLAKNPCRVREECNKKKKRRKCTSFSLRVTPPTIDSNRAFGGREAVGWWAVGLKIFSTLVNFTQRT